MAEEAQVNDTPEKNVKEDASDIQSQIQSAMRSRVDHFKQQADSLTFEGVRRLLEKDLGLEERALDVHKRFIKECLLKSLEGVNDDERPNNSGEGGERGASKQATEGSFGERQSKKDVKDHGPKEEDMEESPESDLLEGRKPNKVGTEEARGNGKKVVPTETIIKKAIRNRASYIKANSEKVTMAGLRRLLEEDLKLDKFTLDPYKKLINQGLDEVLNSSEVLKPAKKSKKIVRNKADNKATKAMSSEESSDTSDQESEEEEKQEEVKPRKRIPSKGKVQNSVGSKKRKGPAEETNLSSKKRIKSARAESEDNSDTEDSGKNSDNDQSHSSPEKPAKKKEVSTPAYGKRVEHLKSVIKACGMSVPPSIYKKIKQVPENKREAQLIKELEEILSKEGLSSDPSEKEIKEVRRKKERAKELEGIDVSNIVSSSRRRSTTSFAAPLKPKVQVETKDEDSKDSDKDSDDDKDDKEEEEDEEDEDEDNSDDDDDDGSQSDEFNEDEEDSD